MPSKFALLDLGDMVYDEVRNVFIKETPLFKKYRINVKFHDYFFIY